ncbi:MAG: hypothetical protein JXX14_05770 [Deltaproteobacteria bacterium]|nr:hypothetical protein [Deltaproteobacteria bacterium]
MIRIYLVLSLMIFAVASGCVDNEQSFYIEHMKVSPDPPECSVSPGDEETNGVGVNLMLAGAPIGSFQATNALISREDYGNLRAESNGIMLEGYELYTYVPTLGVIGGTEYFEYNLYLAPETTDLVFATFLTMRTISQLRTTFGCNPPAESVVAAAIADYNAEESVQRMASAMETAPDPAVVSTELSRARQASAQAAATLTGNLPDSQGVPKIMYSYLKFLGHSQGGKEVETPEFTVVIFPSCGVEGGWEACVANPCTAFCKEDATISEVCSEGVDQPITCSDFLASYKNYAIENPFTGEIEDICDVYQCGK